MIEYIKGELTELTPAFATVEAAGVGYGLNISLNTFTALQKTPSNSPCLGGEQVTSPKQGRTGGVCKLYVFEAIREDAYVLYGFVNKKEREMFELLISVSGVGANTARMMLSGMSVAELCNAISTGNAKLIQGIKGIGKMTAQRIIVDLKDKIVDDVGLLAGSGTEGGAANPAGAARAARRAGGEVGAETVEVITSPGTYETVLADSPHRVPGHSSHRCRAPGRQEPSAAG